MIAGVSPARMQHCDATCSWCARAFWAWLKGRMRAAERPAGRSGAGSFASAAATSIRAGDPRLSVDVVMHASPA